MKARRLSTILLSVSLASLLAWSVAPIGTVIAQPAPQADPAMTDELMARLIKYAHNTRGTATADARICKIFDLCDGNTDFHLKLAHSDSTDGRHYFGFPLQSGSRDILILVKRDSGIESHLTDKTGKLRAAAILAPGEPARLITNEKAAEKFKAELALFAKEAADQLPPTGTNGGAP